jgi:uncharacterized repeat protein (TIGR02543 family)
MKALPLALLVLSSLCILSCGSPVTDSPATSDTPTLSSANDLTAFSFTSPAATGAINGTSISVWLPYGTNAKALVASFTTTGTSVTVASKVQVSGTTPNDFSSPVSYIVTAADKSTKTYTVTVTVAASSAKDLKSFRFLSPAATGVFNGSNIAVAVPYGTKVTALIASFTTTGASVSVGTTAQVSGTTPNDFSSPVSYIVTAADKSTMTFTVTVTVAASSAKELTAFGFISPAATGVFNDSNITVTVPYGTKVTALIASFTTTGASVSIGTTAQVSGTTPNDFSSPVSYIVTAADGSTQTYVVTLSFTYALAYSSNGGSGDAPAAITQYDQWARVNVLANTGSFAKAGFTFCNWNTQANGGGTSYAPGASFYMPSSDITLYAMWGYSVTYDGNGNTGGSAPVDSAGYISGSTATIIMPSSSLVKDGYQFAGWNSQADSLGVTCANTILSTKTRTMTSNISLYAIWIDQNYTTGFVNGTNPAGEFLSLTGATNLPSGIWTIPNGIQFIALNGLSNSTVTGLSLPSNLLIINSNSFAGFNSLTTVTIPASVLVISSTAFSNPSLSNVYMLSETPPALGATVFPSSVTIHVPTTDAITEYRKKAAWNAYATIVTP